MNAVVASQLNTQKPFTYVLFIMQPEKRWAIWAIYAWCRRTDDLVDEHQANLTTNRANVSTPHNLLDLPLAW